MYTCTTERFSFSGTKLKRNERKRLVHRLQSRAGVATASLIDHSLVPSDTGRQQTRVFGVVATNVSSLSSYCNSAVSAPHDAQDHPLEGVKQLLSENAARVEAMVVSTARGNRASHLQSSCSTSNESDHEVMAFGVEQLRLTYCSRQRSKMINHLSSTVSALNLERESSRLVELPMNPGAFGDEGSACEKMTLREQKMTKLLRQSNRIQIKRKFPPCQQGRGKRE